MWLVTFSTLSFALAIFANAGVIRDKCVRPNISFREEILTILKQKQDEKPFEISNLMVKRDSFGMASLLSNKRESRHKRIVGGQQVNIGEWPYLVSLRFKMIVGNNSVPTFEHLCGATLVHPQFIVTALHCVETTEANPYLTQEPNDWLAKVGEHNMNEEEDLEDEIKIEKIISPLTKVREDQLAGNDILLMKLSRPVKIGKYVKPVCLPRKNSPHLKPGDSCMAAGWGLEDENAALHSPVPRHVALPITNRTECGAVYSVFGVKVGADMICAGGHSEGGQDSCRYDSGGPLICRSKYGSWNFIGVISFGAGCGQAGIPGIYTNILEHVDWIEKTIRREL